MPLTPYELNIWSDIRDLLQQLVEKQNMIIEFYMGLEAEGEGRNQIYMTNTAEMPIHYSPEGMRTELSQKDVS